METYPFLWIHNIDDADVAYITRAFEGDVARWKIGAAYRHPEAKALYIHHEDLELAAELMKPPGLETEMVEMAGTKDYLPMVHVISRVTARPTDEEMTYCSIVEAGYAAERINWSEPDAYAKFLEEAGGPADLDVNAAMGELVKGGE